VPPASAKIASFLANSTEKDDFIDQDTLYFAFASNYWQLFMNFARGSQISLFTEKASMLTS
jgi:hypothetical protein